MPRQPVSPGVWLILCVVLLLALAIALRPGADETESHPPVRPQHFTPAAAQTATDQGIQISLPQQGQPAVTATPGAEQPATAPPTMMASEEWRTSHGYFNDEDRLLYASYTLETLRQLTAGGDLLAAEVLFRRYAAEENWQAARVAAMVGAVHGSTASLNLAVEYYAHLARKFANKRPERVRTAWLGALATLEVALMRGDPTVYARGVGIAGKEKLQLSAADLKEISRTANSMYRWLNRERRALGLEAFPDPVNEPYTGAAGAETSTLWGQSFFPAAESPNGD